MKRNIFQNDIFKIMIKFCKNSKVFRKIDELIRYLDNHKVNYFFVLSNELVDFLESMWSKKKFF